MDFLNLDTAKIVLFISVLFFIGSGVYQYVAAKRQPVLRPWEDDYTEQSKKYERYIILVNRNFNLGLVASVIFMLLSCLINMIEKTPY